MQTVVEQSLEYADTGSENLLKMCKVAAEKRLESPLEVLTSFGLYHVGIVCARLKKSDMAYKALSLLHRSFYSSMGTCHDMRNRNIFNMNCCGGYPAVVSELLLQSTEEKIILLPALPEQWHTGRIEGLRARGGFIVDIEWKNNELVKGVITSLNGNKCRVEYCGRVLDLNILKGDKRIVPNEYFKI